MCCRGRPPRPPGRRRFDGRLRQDGPRAAPRAAVLGREPRRDGARQAPTGIEPVHKGFADLSLTTWVRRRGCSEASKSHRLCKAFAYLSRAPLKKHVHPPSRRRPETIHSRRHHHRCRGACGGAGLRRPPRPLRPRPRRRRIYHHPRSRLFAGGAAALQRRPAGAAGEGDDSPRKLAAGAGDEPQPADGARAAQHSRAHGVDRTGGGHQDGVLVQAPVAPDVAADRGGGPSQPGDYRVAGCRRRDRRARGAADQRQSQAGGRGRGGTDSDRPERLRAQPPPGRLHLFRQLQPDCSSGGGDQFRRHGRRSQGCRGQGCRSQGCRGQGCRSQGCRGQGCEATAAEARAAEARAAGKRR